MARIDLELENIAICVPCKKVRTSIIGPPPSAPGATPRAPLFCQTCGTRHITGKVLFELDDGAVQRALFTPEP